MESVVAEALPVARIAVAASFVLVAAVAAVRAHHGGPAAPWAVAAFGALALALLFGAVEDIFGVRLPPLATAVRTILVLSFPYVLLRFSAVFRRLGRLVEIVAAALAALVLAMTLALSPGAGQGGSTPEANTTFVALVVVYWVLLSLVTIVTLWRAGRDQPTVARRRMRLMSAATAVLAAALVLAAEGGDVSPYVQLLVQLIALCSAVTFALGLSPPLLLRMLWRRPEQEQARLATMSVLRATTADEVARELLPPAVRIVGASAAALIDTHGRVVATHGDPPIVGMHVAAAGHVDRFDRTPQTVPIGDGHGGEIVVWTSRYSPFFARDEVELLHGIGAIASVALERCELLAEERAQRAELQLAREEAERAREDASRANTAKSEFLSRMSHELRTPLNAILGFAQLLELSSLSAEDREGVAHILKAGRHLLALIDDVLVLSRIEAGMLTISLEPVETAELVQDAVDLIRPLADARSIGVHVDTGACEVYVRTDRQRCRQILLNLLSNAVKYNRDDGEVYVECVPVDEAVLRIVVRDTGPGIDPARLDRLFNPFDRLGAEASGVEGTGLGLALTKQLVERLGGAIGVQTAPGQGAAFWIDLPVTESAEAAAAAVPQPATHTPGEPDGGGHTLLLIEDNLANLRLVEAMLRRRPGIAVIPAMQGRLALELAQQHRPDVIMLDLHLPDISGREVLHRLRADPRTSDIPVIIGSADATPGRIRQLREEGAFDYVTKPLDVQGFLDALDAALAHRARTQGADPTAS